MISTETYLKSLQRVSSDLPNYIKNIDQIDDDLLQEHIEQFRWLLTARFEFLQRADNIKDYLKEIMKFNYQILLLKEDLYHCMMITEQEIICPQF